jgi:hypothetical protein
MSAAADQRRLARSTFRLVSMISVAPVHKTITILGYIQGKVVSLRRITDHTCVIGLLSIETGELFCTTNPAPCSNISFNHFSKGTKVYWQCSIRSWRFFDVATLESGPVRLPDSNEPILIDEDIVVISPDMSLAQITDHTGFARDGSDVNWPYCFTTHNNKDYLVMYDPENQVAAASVRLPSLDDSCESRVMFTDLSTVIAMKSQTLVLKSSEIGLELLECRASDWADLVFRSVCCLSDNLLFQLVESMSYNIELRVLDTTDGLRQVARFTHMPVGFNWSSMIAVRLKDSIKVFATSGPMFVILELAATDKLSAASTPI